MSSIQTFLCQIHATIYHGCQIYKSHSVRHVIISCGCEVCRPYSARHVTPQGCQVCRSYNQIRHCAWISGMQNLLSNMSLCMDIKYAELTVRHVVVHGYQVCRTYCQTCRCAWISSMQNLLSDIFSSHMDFLSTDVKALLCQTC